MTDDGMNLRNRGAETSKWIGVSTDTRDIHEDQSISDSQSANTILFPFVVQVFGVFIFFILKRFKIPVPYAACMFLMGTLMGLGSVQSTFSDPLTTSILQWTRIDESVLLLVFLPGLIFRDAIEVNFDVFILSLSQILTFAFPMVLVGTGMIAVVCVYVLPYGWSWSLGALMGAILSSTDPVAVAAVLNEAGAPPRLKMHISGESLINDGSALVFYSIFKQIYLSDLTGEPPVGWSEGIILFFSMSLGGFAIGFASALALIVVLYELDRRLDPEYDVLQVVAAISMAYISYFVADQVLSFSGVISCVTCGIVSAWLGKGLINDTKLMDSYLKLMEHMLNSLLFTLGGAMWGAVLFGNVGWRNIWARDWGFLVAFYLLVMVIRFVQVALFYPMFSRVGLKSNPKEAVFFAYGGLRGAVGIALADNLFRLVLQLGRTDDAAGRFIFQATTLVFLSGGISLATLLLNGTLAGPVLRWLGLSLPEVPRKQALALYEDQLGGFVEKEYKRLLADPRFSEIKYDIVKAHVPFLNAPPPEIPSGETVGFHRRTISALSQPPAVHEDCIRRINATRESGDVVPEMRHIYLEMLREAYLRLFSRGELNDKEDEALNVEVFQQSVDFAEADINDQPIHDWESLSLFEKCREDAKTILQQKIKGGWGIFCRQTENDFSPDEEELQYKQWRTKVLRAICFIAAHERANRHLEAYMNFALEHSSREHSWDEVNSAFETVQQEGREEVMEAEEFLHSVPVGIQNYIKSHYVSTIILNRLSKHVEESATEGSLSLDEARSYLKLIEQNAPNHHIVGNMCDCRKRHCTTSNANSTDSSEGNEVDQKV